MGQVNGPRRRKFIVLPFSYQLAQGGSLQADFGGVWYNAFRPTFHGPGLLADMQAMIDLETKRLTEEKAAAERILSATDFRTVEDGLGAPDGNVQTGHVWMTQCWSSSTKRPVHNEIKSATAGIPIYRGRGFHQNPRAPVVRGNLQVVEKPVDQTHKRRWPAQWAAYAQGKDQVADGTPLGLLFPRHPSAIAMLQGLGIMTVQHLANASADRD